MVLKKYMALAFGDKSTLFLSKLNKLYALDIINMEIREVFHFKSDALTFISSFSSVLRRLFRKDIRMALNIDSENLILVKDNAIYRLDTKSKEIKSKVMLPTGSRPLNITKVELLKGFDDGIYFGEYFSNPLKKSVKILKYADQNELITVYEFPEGVMNHIHNLVVDYFRDCIWVLAGDTDDGAAIYQIKNNFKTVERVVFGHQQYRACVLFPLKSGLLYATDSQYESNSIRILTERENGWVSEHVYDINGPCIFGTKIEDTYYFSTSVEGLSS